MKQERITKLSGKILPQIFLQSVIIILSALSSFFFMTWFVIDFWGVDNTYIAAGYELLGTLVIMIITLVPINTVVYRRRAKEVRTLSEAIRRVVEGDYTTRIPTNKKNAIGSVYAAFNKMCSELESVQILRNDFINSYSHEFKTPIASIGGFASLLLEKELPEDERRKYLEIIVDESERLSKLATNTILLSKLSSQQIVTDIERYDLSEQLRQCAIILSHTWMEKKITFNGDFSEVHFSGNKEMMQHLWINLLDNAVKYTPAGGEITVTCREEQNTVIVTISDTGEGIDETTLKNVFNPYFQGDSSHSKQGLGLGLSIVHRIVELCGGSVEVQSVVAVGSTFTVLLPQK